jgi:hypothetical protein
MRVRGLLRETLLKSGAFLARDLVGIFCDVDSSIMPEHIGFSFAPVDESRQSFAVRLHVELEPAKDLFLVAVAGAD